MKFSTAHAGLFPGNLLFLKLARDVLNKTEDFERYVLELSTGIAGAVKIGRQHFGGHGKAFLQRESAVARKA